MIPKEHEILLSLKILRPTDKMGLGGLICRYFGKGGSNIYRCKVALEKYREAALVRKKMIPKNPNVRQRQCS